MAIQCRIIRVLTAMDLRDRRYKTAMLREAQHAYSLPDEIPASSRIEPTPSKTDLANAAVRYKLGRASIISYPKFRYE